MRIKEEKILFVKLNIPQVFGKENFCAGPFKSDAERAWFIIHLNKALVKINHKHKEKGLGEIKYELKPFDALHRGTARRSTWTWKTWAHEIEVKWLERNKSH